MGLRAMFAGTFAACMTATIAGVLLIMNDIFEAIDMNIRKHGHHFPTIDETAWVDSTAVVIGEVVLGKRVRCGLCIGAIKG